MKNRNGNWDARGSPLVLELLQKSHFFFFFCQNEKMVVRRHYSMILTLLWIKQNWRQLNTAFPVCMDFSTRPDFSIRDTVKYWRFWSRVFKRYIVIEKLPHGLLHFSNHSLYINPGAESLKKNWFILDFFFFLVHREDAKRQSHFCRTLEGHHWLPDFITLFRFKFWNVQNIIYSAF